MKLSHCRAVSGGDAEHLQLCAPLRAEPEVPPPAWGTGFVVQSLLDAGRLELSGLTSGFLWVQGFG